jgi:asparagine synthase (glutamine-hydrolysing)
VSGIVGVRNLDCTPIDPRILTRMCAAMAHRGPDARSSWIAGSIGLACQLNRITAGSENETQPVVHSSGVAAVFDGRLDDREELITHLRGERVSVDSPDPELVLAAYLRFGDRFLEHLNGEFSLAVADSRRGRLLLARDAIGTRPLYFYRHGKTFLFASEVKAINSHPLVHLRPNDAHLAQYLLGAPVIYDEGLTFFAEVSSVNPGHMVVLTDAGLQARSYWDFPTHRDSSRSTSDCIEEFRCVFQKAVGRRLRRANPVAISVSGGLDSSSIYCVAQALRVDRAQRVPNVIGLTYSSPVGSPSDEDIYVRDLERALGVQIIDVPIRAGFLEAAKDLMWYGEMPVLDNLGASSTALFRQACQLGARSLLSGTWGDQVLFNDGYIVDLLHHGRWIQALSHLREFNRWNVDVHRSAFAGRLVRNLARRALPRVIIPWLKRARHRRLRSTHHIRFYSREFWNIAFSCAQYGTPMPAKHGRASIDDLLRTVRSPLSRFVLEGCNKTSYAHGVEVDYPMLDRDLITFLISIPGELQNPGGVPRGLLRESMSGLLPERIRQRKDKGCFTLVMNDGIHVDAEGLMALLNPKSLVVTMGYVEGSVLVAELRRLQASIGGTERCDLAWSLSDVAGLELWLQAFFSECPNTEGCRDQAAA